MERCVYYVRIYPGTEAEYDRRHGAVPADVLAAMSDAGLRNVSGFRRGTDVWFYAEAEPDRKTAFMDYAASPANRRWGHAFRDIVAEIEAPDGALIWYDQVFHTDAPPPDGPCEQGFFSLVIDPHRAPDYDALHAQPWPEMIEAIHVAGYRDYTGFRRGAHVVYVGLYYPDMDTVISRINATDVAARWGQAFEGVITTFTDEHGKLFTAKQIFHLD